MFEKLIKLLFYFFLFSFVLGEFSRLPINSIYGAVRLSDLTLLILILVCFVYITIKNKKIVLPQASFAIILFIFISFLSQIYALRLFGSKEILTGSLFLFRFLLYLLLYFVVFNFYQILGKDKILKGIIISSFIISIIGFFQLIYLPDIRFLAVYGWDPHINRMVSTFLDPNFLGAFLILPLILTLITIFKSKINLINALCFVIFFVAIILTFSRSAYLMLFTSLIVIGFFRSKKIIIFVLLSFFIAILLIPKVQERIYGAFTLDVTARARLTSWQNAIKISFDNPLLGVGFNNYRFAQAKYGFFEISSPLGGHSGSGADSSLLFILATTGLLGLGTYLFILIRLFVMIYKLRSNLIGIGAISYLLSLIIGSQFINSLFYPAVLSYFWIYMATIAVKYHQIDYVKN